MSSLITQTTKLGYSNTTIKIQPNVKRETLDFCLFQEVIRKRCERYTEFININENFQVIYLRNNA